jgi:hypothetical protein
MPRRTKTDTMELCVDAAFDTALYTYDPCESTFVLALSLHAARDLRCDGPVMRRIVQSTTMFTGDTAYRTDIKMHVDAGRDLQKETKGTHEGKWTGPCPAGARPGEMTSKLASLTVDIARMMDQR